MVLSTKAYVKEHHLFGYTSRGIFAKESIHEGDVIWKQEGNEVIRTYTASEIRSDPQKEILIKYSYMLDDDTFCTTFDPEEDHSFFFNHSCEPNVGYKGDNQLIAMRDISKGEHLVYDYAFTDTESSMHYGLRCLCGSKECRLILTFGQWRSRTYMKKYGNYVTRYISNKYAENGWFDPRIERRLIDKESKRYGLFIRSGNAVKAGETIVVFGGKVVHYNDMFDAEGAGFTSKDYEMSIQIHDDMWQIQSVKGDVCETADHLNHSCDPNCGMADSITVVAMRNIESNEEVTIDYAMVNSGIVSMKCDNFLCICGSSMCRGKFTSSDWKIPQLQRRYKNFFSPFVQRMITKSRVNCITKS